VSAAGLSFLIHCGCFSKLTTLVLDSLAPLTCRAEESCLLVNNLSSSTPFKTHPSDFLTENDGSHVHLIDRNLIRVLMPLAPTLKSLCIRNAASVLSIDALPFVAQGLNLLSLATTELTGKIKSSFHSLQLTTL
jgi:hypothetical protein